MKKLVMLVLTLMLGASLAIAQNSQGTSGSTDKPAATKTTKKTAKKSTAKKEKAPKAKKADTSSK